MMRRLGKMTKTLKLRRLKFKTDKLDTKARLRMRHLASAKPKRKNP